MLTVEPLLQLAFAQIGKPYVFGVEVRLDDPSPATFDCSELVQWVCARAGVQPEMPDGSWIQYLHCRQNATVISVDEAIRTRGALLFTNRDAIGAPMEPADVNDVPPQGHVAFSLGDGKTVEAMGTKWGVRQGDATGRTWTQGARIPGVSYSAATDVPTVATPPATPVADPNHPWLQVGAGGEGVERMQRMLLAVGAHSMGKLPANGSFTELTDIAVRLFQWYIKRFYDPAMEVDGKCGPVTWGWLEKISAE
jgi:cell wall-associated NlpC family hydrolase